MNIHGAIQVFVMQIISLMNKKISLIFIVLLQLVSGSTIASGTYSILVEQNKLYILNSNIKSLVPLVENTTEWFVINELKEIDGYTYLAVFHKKPSSPGRPDGFCGSGSELWLHIYKIYENKISDIGGILAGSCKKSFSIASLESGLSNSDRDYSSFKWNGSGFSIEWFSKKDENGKDIIKTFYSLRNGSIYSE